MPFGLITCLAGKFDRKFLLRQSEFFALVSSLRELCQPTGNRVATKLAGWLVNLVECSTIGEVCLLGFLPASKQFINRKQVYFHELRRILRRY